MIGSLLTFVALISTVAFAVILLFLPAFVELIKPADSGPRLIWDSPLAEAKISREPVFKVDYDSNSNQPKTVVDNIFNFISNIED